MDSLRGSLKILIQSLHLSLVLPLWLFFGQFLEANQLLGSHCRNYETNAVVKCMGIEILWLFVLNYVPTPVLGFPLPGFLWIIRFPKVCCLLTI